MIQIIVTIIIALAVIYILFKNIKKSAKGDCSCNGTCAAKCPKKEKSNCSSKIQMKPKNDLNHK